ncbi:MAG: NUDIX domain-containing protein [Candidatus Nanoarchaeia archaeon]|nr:NUDIX domain-containing protein [Candidatus Nanoarchaeia archaeon]
MRTIQLMSIIYRKNKNKYEFLLLKRIPEKGGFWQPPCGGLEKEDKSKLEGCFREIKEETGISKDKIIKIIENIHSFTMNKHYLTKEPIKPITEYVFAFEVDKNVNVKLDSNIYPEHSEYCWVSFDKALNLLKWENNKDSFKKLKEVLL